MLIKNLLTRNSNYHHFQYLNLNIRVHSNVLLKIRNCSTDLIDHRKSCLTNHRNASKSRLQSYTTRGFVPIQMDLRYKSSNAGKKSTLEEASEKNTDVPLTIAEKLKRAMKEYGSTVIVFHVTISLASLGTCYLLVTSGLDITKVFTALGLNDWVTKSQIATGAGTFAVAYAIHKVFAPVRMAITLASVPLIVRYLRRIGFLKK